MCSGKTSSSLIQTHVNCLCKSNQISMLDFAFPKHVHVK